MSNIEQIIEKLILGMRDGKEPDDIFEELEREAMITDTKLPVMSKETALDLANYIVLLYDGKFPVEHLHIGDICIDAFRSNPCIITNINDHSIHVLYFNGKTHKFKRYQERQFKKLDQSVSFYLHTLLEGAMTLVPTIEEE